MKKEILYYSHSKKIYGTPEESSQLEYIEKTFPEHRLIDPSILGELQPFLNYLRIVSNCDLLVCSEYLGFVGRGVCEEVMRGLILNKPVWVIKKYNSIYKLLAISDVDVIGIDNKIKFAKLVLNTTPD